MRESHAADRDAGTTAWRRVPRWVIVATVPVVALIAVFVTDVWSGNGGTTVGSAATADTVDIKDFSFSPNPITVKAGQTITVANQDNVTHTLTANGGAFNTGDLGGGRRDSISAASAGTYAYHCEIHTFMTGTVRVSP
jgi:plastocyanin